MTKGRAALLRALRRTRVVYVAARCEVTPSAVYNWVAGRYVPSRRSRLALEVNYGIPVESWGVDVGRRRKVNSFRSC